MELAVPYHEIQDAYTVNRWDTGQHFCIRITISDGSVLLRVSMLVACAGEGSGCGTWNST